MKKVILMMLTLCMVISAVACDGGSKKSGKASTEPTATATTTPIATAPPATPTAKPSAEPFDPPVPDVLEFALDSNGTAYNKTEGGPALTTVGNGITLGTDASTGMQIVQIPAGQEGYYTMPMSKELYSKLMNGYTMELYLNIPCYNPESPFGMDGHDFVSCDEWDGGFGVIASPDDVLTIRQKISSWQMIDVLVDYEYNTWIHLVITCNGKDTLSVYTDGALYNTSTIDYGTTPLPPNVDFFCIGGNAVPPHLNETTEKMVGCSDGGFIGICNIYTTELSEEDVYALYELRVEALKK